MSQENVELVRSISAAHERGDYGSADPGIALRVYRQAMRRAPQEAAQLRTLVEDSALTEAAEARQDALVEG